MSLSYVKDEISREEMIKILRPFFAEGIQIQRKAPELKLDSNGIPFPGPEHTTNLGRGLFETVLIEHGFKKSELKKFCEEGVLEKCTTRFMRGWRNTYVLKEDRK